MPTVPRNSPTVFVVDNDRRVRASLVTQLETLGVSVRTFASGSGFARYYRPHMPGCLVLEVGLPGQNGLEFYEQLLRDGKRLPVIFITAHADVPMAVAAMKTGAVDFLEKPNDRQILLDRVRAALALDVQRRERDAQYRAVEGRIRRLSDRERETLELILAGESNKSMAAKLFLTERAVEMRRASIMRKLEVRSLAELLDLAVTHRMLDELRQAARQLPAR